MNECLYPIQTYCPNREDDGTCLTCGWKKHESTGRTIKCEFYVEETE